MDAINMKYDQNSESQVEIRSDDFTYSYSSSTEPPARERVTVCAGNQPAKNASTRTGLRRGQLLRANTHTRMFHIVTWIRVVGGLICRERARRAGCR